jgi:hypothetical protein
MTDTVDEILKAKEKHDLTCDFFQHVMGVDERTAEMLAKAEADKFDFKGGVRLTTKDGKPVNDPSVAEHYRAEFPQIFKEPEKKTAAEQVGEVPPAIVAAALNGSVTARGQAFIALKLDQRDPNAVTVLDAYLDAQRLKGATAKPADDNVADLAKAGGSNPWKPETWSLTKQMQITRSSPDLAARLADKAGSRLGWTKRQTMRTA